MIKKIISGGQSGADQAALDAAIKFQIPHGGWIPKGRLTETGRLPDRYKLQEMPTDSYPARTEQNVIDSDGTLIISHGSLIGGSKYTEEMTLKHDRPCLHIDLNIINTFKAAAIVLDWINIFKIETLNVAGPKASKDPYIYQATMNLLTTVFHMGLIKLSMPDLSKTTIFLPTTIEEAVNILIDEISLKDKAHIANMPESELASLHLTLGNYICNKFRLWSGNEALLHDCRTKLEKYDIHEDEASSIIIKKLWNLLRETYALRIVKGRKADDKKTEDD